MNSSEGTNLFAELGLEFPIATLKDFEEEVPMEERKFCLQRYNDLNKVKQARMHCTSCNKHLGLCAQNVNRLRMHPLLRTLVCSDCLEFYNSGEFLKGEDGSELYCRWCGQGGQVYCCSSCPVVFCENCIKRNFGAAKIDDIESIDDWSCFVCHPRGLWCHRSALWAALRYCDYKNRFTHSFIDPFKRIQLQKECQIDESVCCKKKQKTPINQAKSTSKSISEIKKMIFSDKKSSIDSKKTLSIAEAQKAIKRLGSPLSVKKLSQAPQTILANLPSALSITSPSSVKKIAISPHAVSHPAKNSVNRSYTGTPAMRGEKKGRRINNTNFNSSQNFKSYNGIVPTAFSSGVKDCYSNIIPNDNLNLSLESLTHGLDVSNLPNPELLLQSDDDNVVCTPDFPPMSLEPVCEVTEDLDEDCTEIPVKQDDDVQCLTPTPKIVPKPLSALTEPKPILNKSFDFNPANVIQMSEKDVSINKVSGGLKFRVDPATLSTSKMYQLPDGRVFAVNLNPKMPGGYSATIVTVNEASMSLMLRPGLTVRPPAPRGAQQPSILENTLSGRPKRQVQNKAAHSWTSPVISSVKSPSKTVVQETPTKSPSVSNKNTPNTSNTPKSQNIVSKKPPPNPTPASNKHTPASVEWYTYNLCDAVDLVSYVSRKLQKVKDTPTGNLRTKSIQEMKEMHHTLDQLLKISCQRLTDVRNNLNQDFKGWLKEKCSIELFSDDDAEDEDKVEITSEVTPIKPAPHKKTKFTSEEPIFIDENSNDSIRYVNAKIPVNHSKNTRSKRRSKKEGVIPIIENVMCEINEDADSNKGNMSVDDNEMESTFDMSSYEKSNFEENKNIGAFKDPLEDGYSTEKPSDATKNNSDAIDNNKPNEECCSDENDANKHSTNEECPEILNNHDDYSNSNLDDPKLDDMKELEDYDENDLLKDEPSGFGNIKIVNVSGNLENFDNIDKGFSESLTDIADVPNNCNDDEKSELEEQPVEKCSSPQINLSDDSNPNPNNKEEEIQPQQPQPDDDNDNANSVDSPKNPDENIVKDKECSPVESDNNVESLQNNGIHSPADAEN